MIENKRLLARDTVIYPYAYMTVSHMRMKGVLSYASCGYMSIHLHRVSVIYPYGYMTVSRASSRLISEYENTPFISIFDCVPYGICK